MKAISLRWIWAFIIGFILSLCIGQVQTYAREACDLAEKNCLVMEETKTIRTAEVARSGKTQGTAQGQRSDTRSISLTFITLAKGSDHAAITIIEYSDFGYPSCTVELV